MIVYALVDDAGVVRYIGQTFQSVQKRISEHRHIARSKPTTRLHEWLRSIGRRPTYFVLDECETKDELDEIERFWIDWHRKLLGSSLTNMTDGGPGGRTRW